MKNNTFRKMLLSTMLLGVIAFSLFASVLVMAYTIPDAPSVKITIGDGTPLENEANNQGLSTISPEFESQEVEPYDGERPTATWNIKNQGRYDFTGTSHGATRYTSLQIYGKE